MQYGHNYFNTLSGKLTLEKWYTAGHTEHSPYFLKETVLKKKKKKKSCHWFTQWRGGSRRSNPAIVTWTDVTEIYKFSLGQNA